MKMVSRELEFRGIHRTHLGVYFEELGGRLVTDSFPFLYEGDGWRGEVLSEVEIAFTSVFRVNAVKIRFLANSDEELDRLIENYRYKTFRVGG
jgi:hypothetical protein